MWDLERTKLMFADCPCNICWLLMFFFVFFYPAYMAEYILVAQLTNTSTYKVSTKNITEITKIVGPWHDYTLAGKLIRHILLEKVGPLFDFRTTLISSGIFQTRGFGPYWQWHTADLQIAAKLSTAHPWCESPVLRHPKNFYWMEIC